MNLTGKTKLFKALSTYSTNGDLQRATRYQSDEAKTTVASELLSNDEITDLLALANQHGEIGLTRKIAQLRSLQADPSGAKVKRLEVLATAAKSLLAATPNKWLFSEESDGYALPYYVAQITYNPSEPQVPASTQFKLGYFENGDVAGASITFDTNDLKGQTVSELLKKKGYYIETPNAVESYLRDIEKHKALWPLIGGQFSATGTAFENNDSWYSNDSLEMTRDGVPSKVVIDSSTESKKSRSRGDGKTLVSGSFWTGKRNDDEDESSVAPPLHPYIRVFDLSRHTFASIHVNNLEPYIWDDTLIDKLVLPQDKKDLISILIQGSSASLEDIVKGKTGGIIVIATGAPGTGKTLTAEVFSETIRRPLYVVQCSQLGTDEEKLEKSLSKVLERASRWKAILLIDEADVYIHERGNDIRQNAIVGVFLRVLEYYRGVLFMTSNRSTIIDDAIMSRATAWIRYEKPQTDEELRSVWRVLSTQYKVELSAETVARLLKEFPAPNIAGRTIKNLLKLAKLLSLRTGKPVDHTLLKYVSGFQDMDGKE